MSNLHAVSWWWWLASAAVVVIGSACVGATGREPWELADLTEEPVERTRLDGEAGFDVERVRFRSEATRDLRFFIALIPKGHRSIEEALILNHGWGDRPETLMERADVVGSYGELLAQGNARPAILVIPDLRFDAEYRRNSEKYPFPQYLGLIGEEIYTIVSELYSVPPDREKWHVMGFSFGGLVSLDVGRRYSARFGNAGVISAFGDPEWSYWPEEPPAPGYLDARGRGKHTVVDPGPAPRLLLACGTEDRFYPRMVQLHEQLADLGVAHEWLTGSGEHDFKYWKNVLRPALLFHLGTSALPGRRE